MFAPGKVETMVRAILNSGPFRKDVERRIVAPPRLCAREPSLTRRPATPAGAGTLR
jgi:hypothetical protein